MIAANVPHRIKSRSVASGERGTKMIAELSSEAITVGVEVKCTPNVTKFDHEMLSVVV